MAIEPHRGTCAGKPSTRIFVLVLIHTVLVPLLANSVAQKIGGKFIWQADWRIGGVQILPLKFPEKVLVLPLGF
jgi:hypothetical protein